MNKTDIKKILRESIFELEEASKRKVKKEKKKKETKKDGDDFESLSQEEKEHLNSQTIEIRNTVGPGKPLKYVQVLRASGLIPTGANEDEEATLLSLYRKKILNKSETVDGVKITRRLSIKDADILYKVIKNPGSFK